MTEQNHQASNKWLVLVALSLAIFMLNVDWTGVNIAIPAIGKTFHIGLSGLQWIINAYILSAAMFMLTGGRLADIFGKKIILTLGLTLFVSSSFLAGIAANHLILIIARVIQGVGFAVLLPMAFAILFSVFPVEQRGVAAGILTCSTGLGQAFGPTLCGIVIKLLTWRWFFFINVPFGLLSIIILLISFKESKNTSKESIDYVGATLLALSMLLVLLAVNESIAWGMGSFEWIFSVVVGLMLMLVFLLLQLKVKHPLLDLSIFKVRRYSITTLVRVFFQLGYTGFFFVIVLYLQNIMGYTAFESGLILFVMTLFLGVASPISGKLIDKIGGRMPLMFAMLMFSVSFIYFSFVSLSPNIILFALALILLGTSSGMVFSGGATVALASMPVEKSGIASGAFFMNAMVVAVIGVAVDAYVLSRYSFHLLMKQLTLQHISLNMHQLIWVKRVADGSHAASILHQHGLSQSMILPLTQITQRSFMQSFHLVMYINVICGVLGLITASFLKKWA